MKDVIHAQEVNLPTSWCMKYAAQTTLYVGEWRVSRVLADRRTYYTVQQYLSGCGEDTNVVSMLCVYGVTVKLKRLQ